MLWNSLSMVNIEFCGAPCANLEVGLRHYANTTTRQLTSALVKMTFTLDSGSAQVAPRSAKMYRIVCTPLKRHLSFVPSHDDTLMASGDVFWNSDMVGKNLISPRARGILSPTLQIGSVGRVIDGGSVVPNWHGVGPKLPLECKLC